MKAARSFLQCRQSNRKCIRPGSGECCESCQHRKLKCSAQLRRQRRDHTRSFAEPIWREEQARSPTTRNECENPPNLPWETMWNSLKFTWKRSMTDLPASSIRQHCGPIYTMALLVEHCCVPSVPSGQSSNQILTIAAWRPAWPRKQRDDCKGTLKMFPLRIFRQAF